jgi:hypothetical protein
MNEPKNTQFVGTAERLKNNRTGTQPKNEQLEIEKQNTRTLMQAFHGCRQNCQECYEEEKE